MLTLLNFLSQYFVCCLKAALGQYEHVKKIIFWTLDRFFSSYLIIFVYNVTNIKNHEVLDISKWIYRFTYSEENPNKCKQRCKQINFMMKLQAFEIDS